MDHEGAALPADVSAGLVLGCVAVAALWAVAVRRASTRSGWSGARSAFFAAGTVLAAASLAVSTGSGDMRTHMAAHVILGMAAPVLLALSAPVTLALRALPVRRARTLSRVLRSRPVHVATRPFAAAVLDAGGLWLIYRGGLHERAIGHPAVSAVLGAHVLLTGTLLAAVLLQIDPVPRRPPAMRAAALLAVMASHNVLAKAMYADPPGWAAEADGGQGALIMYYGGDAVHVVLVVLVCRAWARASGDARRPQSPCATAACAPSLWMRGRESSATAGTARPRIGPDAAGWTQPEDSVTT